MTLEQHVMSVLARLPKDSTLDDFIAELQLDRDLKEAEADIKAGRVHSHEDVEKMVAEWQRSFGQTKPSGN